ncbi:MAG: thiamine ABC transporter substrate-binding protein, partial [Bdellovibrionota bacterium]
PDLVIYAYDSFVAKGGLGGEILPLFEKKCGCHVRALGSGDGGQLLTRLQLDAERKQPGAQIVLGLDQQTWPRAQPYLEEWGEWTPTGYDRLPRFLQIARGFLPIDYGYFSLIGDRKTFEEMKIPFPEKPIAFRGLSEPQFARKILLEDPRTSTPGLAFLLMTKALAGAEFGDYWKSFRRQWLTLTPGWDAAYGLFLKEQAPLVWSYTTSQAYHREHGDLAGRYAAILFEEGEPLQIEGAALIRGGTRGDQQRKLARGFLEFLLSSDVQAQIPLRNWMLPVKSSGPLPKSFRDLPVPTHRIPVASDPAEINRTLQEWSKAVGQAR